MMELLFFGLVAGGLLIALLFLAREHRNRPHMPSMPSVHPVEDLFPAHARYFPPIRQAISEADMEYLSGRVRQASLRHARAERYDVVRGYLGGLRRDFIHVEELSRALASLSPSVDRRLEWERIRLGLQFRGLYCLAWFRIGTGLNSIQVLTRLTNVVADLTARVEAVSIGLARLSESPAQRGGAQLA